jgi:hypothetical protein
VAVVEREFPVCCLSFWKTALHLEILALRHQFGVVQRSVKATEANRFEPVPVGVAVIHLAGLAIGTDLVQPETVIRLAPQGIPRLLELAAVAPVWRPKHTN